MAKAGHYRRLRDRSLDGKAAVLAGEIRRVPERRRNLNDALAWAAARWAVDQAVAAGATVTFTPDQRDFGPRLQAVITRNSELQERDAFKRAGLAAAMTDALHKRGVPDPTASLAAELGVLAFHRAFARWIDPANRQTFTDLARQTLHELQAATATLD